MACNFTNTTNTFYKKIKKNSKPLRFIFVVPPKMKSYG